MHRPTICTEGTFVVRENLFMVVTNTTRFHFSRLTRLNYETDNSEFYMNIKFKCILNQDG